MNIGDKIHISKSLLADYAESPLVTVAEVMRDGYYLCTRPRTDAPDELLIVMLPEWAAKGETK